MSPLNGRAKAGDEALAAGQGLRVVGPGEEAAMLALAEEVVWGRPRDLEEKKAPELDLSVFPAAAAAKIDLVSRKVGVAPDIPASSFIGLLSACIMGEFEVEIGFEHVEPVTTWNVAFGKAGEGKSPSLRAIVGPGYRWEREQAEACRDIVIGAKVHRRVLETREEQARKKLEKAPNDENAQVDFKQATADLAAHVMPEPPLLSFGDITSEAMGQQLPGQRGRGSVLASEAGLLDTIAGRYSSGGRPNVDLWLSGFDGDPHRVHRTKRDGENLSQVLITLAVMAQPGHWVKLLGEDYLRHKGFFDRFWFFFPDTRLGNRVHVEVEAPADVSQAYEDMVLGLFRKYRGASLLPPARRRLRLCRNGRRRFLEMKRKVEPLMAEGARLESISGWVSKLPGKVVRLAALFFVCEQMPDGAKDLPVSYIDRAWRLAETYFIPHAERAFGIIPEDADAANARRILSRLVGRKDQRFGRSLINRLSGLDAESLESALDLLIEKNWLRPVEDRQTGGRPKTLYLLNPDAKRAFEAKAPGTNPAAGPAIVVPIKVPNVGDLASDAEAMAAQLELEELEERRVWQAIEEVPL